MSSLTQFFGGSSAGGADFFGGVNLNNYQTGWPNIQQVNGVVRNISAGNWQSDWPSSTHWSRQTMSTGDLSALTNGCAFMAQGPGSAIIFRNVAAAYNGSLSISADSWAGKDQQPNINAETGPESLVGIYFSGGRSGAANVPAVSISSPYTVNLIECYIVSNQVSLTGIQELVDTTSSFIAFAPGISSGGGTQQGSRMLATNCKLNAASVNKILIDCANQYLTPTFTNSTREVNLSGGTSAGTSSLTAAGQAAVTKLTSNNYTVTLNS